MRLSPMTPGARGKPNCGSKSIMDVSSRFSTRYDCCTMAKGNTVTQRRSALNSQPIPTWSSQANSSTDRAREDRRISLSDAAITVRWLNGAKLSKPRASYERVRSILQQLTELRDIRLELRQFGPDLEEWKTAILEHEEKKKLLKAGKVTFVRTRFPADRNPGTPDGEKLYAELNARVDSLASALNEQLRRYVFHPRVDYVRLPGSITVLQNIWAGGMTPDHHRGWFEITVNGRPISEADAALALVRLDLADMLSKVVLCEMCKERWLVASRRRYRFCSQGCRETFYTNSGDYHSRKASSQKRYRANLKRMHKEQDKTW
jgi:hypothetical protein